MLTAGLLRCVDARQRSLASLMPGAASLRMAAAPVFRPFCRCYPIISWPARCYVLQHVLGEDLKASDIEVGVASAADGGRFRVLSGAELDEHLAAISERD